jgi:hypothetical protein
VAFASSQSGFAGLFAVELATERAGSVDGTSFPAAPSFPEFAGSGVLGMAAFALLAVSAVELQGHYAQLI